jgi:NADPH:quinone reductase-like Zn-dependent oxidoreductase
VAILGGSAPLKGFGFDDHGGAEKLRWVEIPEPLPGPGEVRVSLRAASFNRLDRFVLEGIPGVPISRPHVIGSDGAGVIDAVGMGSPNLQVGQEVLINPGMWDGTCESCRAGREELCRGYRILGEHTQGTLAQSVVVPARNVHPKPGHLSFAEAAAAPLVYQTAWRALFSVGSLTSGETVAVIGAGGGVATAAVRVAKLGGARVVVLSRSEEKLQRARELGADDGLLIPSDGNFERLLWEWSGKRGCDLVFDSAGSGTLPHSLRVLARGGRAVVVGATTGPIAEIDLRTLFWRQASLRGSTMANRAEFQAMYEALARGDLRPVVDREFPFGAAGEAFARFTGSEVFGKVVIRIR